MSVHFGQKVRFERTFRPGDSGRTTITGTTRPLGLSNARACVIETGNAVLDRLPPRSVERLRPYLTLRPFEPGEVLQASGADEGVAYFPRHGAVGDHFVSVDGTSICTSMVGREGMLGLPLWLGARDQHSEWVAVSRGDAFRAPLHLIDEGCTPTLHRLAAARLYELRQSVACQRVHSLEQRTARCLLEFAERVRVRDLVVTHDRLAGLVGSTRPRVTAALQRLEDGGAIRRRRGAIELLDPARLAEDACECYFTVWRAFEALGIARERSLAAAGRLWARAEATARRVARGVQREENALRTERD